MVLLAYLIITIVSAILLTPISWPIGLIAWVAIEVVLLLAVITWHSRTTVYSCPNCGANFNISPLTDLVSPHGTKGGGWKYLRCPACGKMVKASMRERK
jgi:DNA-directed RNA polymerase subunit RPC12/RpoP